MDLEALEEIGLTPNEAKTYYVLAKTGQVTAGKLTKKVGIHRSRVYEALERLMQKGLVHYSKINNIKYFQIKDTSFLLDLLNEKKNNIEKMIPKLTKASLYKEQEQNVEAYTGVGGVKTVLQETLKAEEYLVFGAPKFSLEIMGETFWANYNQKAYDKKIKTKMIFNEDLREWSKVITKINPRNKIMFLEEQFDSISETFILDNKIIIVIWTPVPLGIVIKDVHAALSYKHFFKVLWDRARR